MSALRDLASISMDMVDFGCLNIKIPTQIKDVLINIKLWILS